MIDAHDVESQDETPGEGLRPAVARTQEDALQMIHAADERAAAANKFGRPDAKVQAAQQLQTAVDDARDIGVDWGPISDRLGIARGNAYQRYRHRPA